jgi:hypothetical protein
MTGSALLILKRGDPSRRRDDDYDVLEDGKVVGRIIHLEAAAPEGRPWMRASGHNGEVRRAAHGCEKFWRRRTPLQSSFMPRNIIAASDRNPFRVLNRSEIG